MEKLIEPFKILEDYLTCCFILTSFSEQSIITLVNIVRKSTQLDNISINQVENLNQRLISFPELYGRNFFLKTDLDKKVNELIKLEEIDHFNSNALECSYCGAQLGHKSKPYQAMCYYYHSTPKKAVIHSKICEMCNANHFISYAESNSNIIKRKSYEFILDKKFIAFTTETIFEITILESLTSDMLFKHSTFMGYTNAYNHLFKCEQDYSLNTDKIKRCCMNEQRLTEAWFYYQFLKAIKEIPVNSVKCQFPYVQDLDQSIRELKPSLLQYFIKFWSGKNKKLN